MKKFISVLLACVLLATLMVPLASCGLIPAKWNPFAKRIHQGTEAAKLLLANERLDENLFLAGVDVGMKSKSGKTDSAKNTASHVVTNLSATPKRGTTLLPLAIIESDTTHTWTEFGQYSASAIEFSQFVESVDYEVERVARNIANMKENVGVTDKWVDLGTEKHMLRVFENYDVLFVIGYYGDQYVYYRYTDENAKNVYVMYSFMSYEDGTTGDVRTLCIPGERYEYMYDNSNGFSDYFIAENSRGYWINTRFSCHEDEFGNVHTSFSPYIVKDGLGAGAFVSAIFVPGSEDATVETAWYNVFDPANERELFRISTSYNRYSFQLYTPAIRNGLVSISADQVVYDDEENIYQSSYVNQFVTVNGTYRLPDDYDGSYGNLPARQFAFTSGDVHYDYAEEVFCGGLEFTMDQPTVSVYDACIAFGDYAKTLGLDLYCDMDTVALSTEYAMILADGFIDTFEWNGYHLNTRENAEAAMDALTQQFESALADYEEVKDFESSSGAQTLSYFAHFAEFDSVKSDGNTYSDGLVNVDLVTVSTSDVDLFEEDMEYVLKVGISKVDENGDPISVNTVALKGTESMPVAFDGGEITLEVSGEYEIPKNLDAGRYAVVVYVATKEDGIRVSEMQKIDFVSISEGEVDSAAMSIFAFEQDKNLMAEYTIKNIRYMEITDVKATYSYDEIRKIIMTEILSHGAPYHGAVLEYENGEAVPEEATLGSGTYRMMCYLATADGLAQSYVYLTVTEIE